MEPGRHPTARTGKILAATPMNRFGEPEELAGTLLFLCDEAYSGFITGVNIPVDGGFNAYSRCVIKKIPDRIRGFFGWCWLPLLRRLYLYRKE